MWKEAGKAVSLSNLFAKQALGRKARHTFIGFENRKKCDKMSEVLASGATLKTETGATVVVDRLLGEGGQGRVYKVKYNGRPKALKMYIPEKVKNLKWFHENLTEEIHNGRPSDKFIWPEDLTEWQNGTFGYIMDLRPADYMEFGDLLLAKQEMSSFTAMINCALRMISAFRVLHSKGMCYQDLNDGNFFLRAKDGDVLVCDNDNASPLDNPSGIAGKARYMAPSVVMGGKPNYNTDRFSLATCLFLLLVRTHPLEGIRTLTVPEMNDYYLQLCYGKDPIFIADPTDRSNAPSKDIDGVRNFFIRWPLLTKKLQEMFIQTFSKEAMLHNEKKFSMERDWQRALLQYRAHFVKCPVCGRETLYRGEPICSCCHKKYPIYGYFKFSNFGAYKVPIIKNGGIFQEYIDDFAVANVQFKPERISVVRVNSAKKLVALENLSTSKWRYSFPDGTSGTVSSGEFIPLKDQTKIKIGDEEITVTM